MGKERARYSVGPVLSLVTIRKRKGKSKHSFNGSKTGICFLNQIKLHGPSILPSADKPAIIKMSETNVAKRSTENLLMHKMACTLDSIR
jgi:hypothetical protein